MATINEHYLKLEFVSNETNETPSGFISNKVLPFAESPVYCAKVVFQRCLTKGDDVKTVYDVSLDIQDVEHEFLPGQTIGILPCNNKKEVEQLIHRLNLTSVCHTKYRLSVLPEECFNKFHIPSHIPVQGTLYELFVRHVDIRSIPKKSFLRFLSNYTNEEEEIKMLERICSPAGSKHYQEFILSNRTLLCLLTTISSCHPPIESLLEYLPPLLPRPYSIASSPLIKTPLHIIFDVVYSHNESKGVCTGWMENIVKNVGVNADISNISTKLMHLDINLKNEVCIPFYFRKCNNFRLPLDPLVPIIMIGSGTGIAPFIGFLEHRYLEIVNNKKFGSSWLIYGCRYSNRDFLHKSKLEEYLTNGTLTKLLPCYSRESITKTYVQDIIKGESKEFINKIVNENAIVYVCGDARHMVKDVKNTITSCLVDNENMSLEQAKSYIKNLEQTNRYIQDSWI